MKFLQAIISFILLVLTLCFVSLGMGPNDAGLSIRTFNPFDGIADIIFLIHNNLEFQKGISLLITIIILLFLWFIYFIIINRFFSPKRKNYRK